MRQVAAFDFDGTLVAGDSLLPFVWRYAGRRRFVRASIADGPRAVLASLARIGSRDQAKAAFVSTALRNLPVTTLADAGIDYSHRLQARVRPAGLDRINWHIDRGHELVLVSASLSLYLAPLAERLGFAATLATGLEVGNDGRATGRLDGANVRGPEKVARLRRWLGGDGDATPVELWAYGDSAGDAELLGLADHGFLVRRGRFGAVEA